MKRMNPTSAAILFALTTSALPAHAHISMKGDLQSRGGDQKSSPCDGKRGDGPVYTFAPGATITLAVNEDIPHPSYFRIAFDNDGQDFVEPASIDPIDKTRACPFNSDDQCGKSDYCSKTGASKGAIVLWDDLDPHLAAAAKGGSWTVKLPDVECDNCTLQVLQIMEDTVHGAYCPQGSCANSDKSLEDIYHRCIDIKLVKGAPSGPGVTMDPVKNNGMECASSAPAGGAAGSSAAAGAAAGGTGGAAAPEKAGSGGSSAATGAGGAPAAANGGASAASSTPATAKAGSGASANAGGSAAPASSSSGASTTPAAPSSNNSAAAGSKSTGTATGAATGTAGSAATESAPAAKSSGGCAVAANSSNDGAALGLLLTLGLVLARRRR